MLDEGSASRDAGSSSAHWHRTIASAQVGDRDALGELFHRLRGYLKARAQERIDGHLGTKISPSDVVQETLLEAYRSFDTFHGGSRAELVVWLQGILNHRVKTANRTFRGTSKRNINVEMPQWLRDDSANEFDIAAEQQSPSWKAIEREERERLDAALKQLSRRHEQVIRLRNELKLSFSEIGQAIDCSDDAAQKLWTRAVHRLGQLLNYESRKQDRA
ncbi:MAG: sigma-70 family RNA polymerase sigma factor [Planctomycetales bacterium]|nr:sigma-70 family RNA polymerase sigma factor [Planctomycetales bacterium]